MREYSCDYRIYTKKIYIISGKVKRFKVQLLRSNALFLCRHEDTSSLRLFSDERSGRQIIRNQHSYTSSNPGKRKETQHLTSRWAATTAPKRANL